MQRLTVGTSFVRMTPLQASRTMVSRPMAQRHHQPHVAIVTTNWCRTSSRSRPTRLNRRNSCQCAVSAHRSSPQLSPTRVAEAGAAATQKCTASTSSSISACSAPRRRRTPMGTRRMCRTLVRPKTQPGAHLEMEMAVWRQEQIILQTSQAESYSHLRQACWELLSKQRASLAPLESNSRVDYPVSVANEKVCEQKTRVDYCKIRAKFRGAYADLDHDNISKFKQKIEELICWSSEQKRMHYIYHLRL